MFHTTLPNLVLILFVACSSISTSISQKPPKFKFIYKQKPNSINLRVRYPYSPTDIRITSLKFNSKDIQVSQEDSQWINDLEPCTTYNVEAILQNLTTKKKISHKENITTGKSIPKTEIHKIIPTLNSVNVSLRYVNSNCANSIEFFINSNFATSFDKSNLREYIEINRLVPCTSYKIRVKTYYGYGAWNKQEETSVSEIFSTEAVDIPPIENIKFDDVTGLLSWEPPVSGSKCVKNYEVRLENEFHDDTKTTNVESLNLSAYPGCSNFTISITPEGLNGKRFAKSNSINIQTGIKEPSSVMNLMGSPSSNSINISWGSPSENPDCVKKYVVKYSNKREITDSMYRTPDTCEDESQLVDDRFYHINANLLQYEITNLKPYTKYTVQMAVENSASIGNYSEPTEVITKPYSPHQVNNFRVDRLNYDHTVELKWDLPCEINGEIIAIKGTFYESPPTSNGVISYEWKLKSSNDLTLANFYKSKPIKPEHIYNITIGIELQNYTGPMNETSIIYISPAGIPAAYLSSNWGLISEARSPRDHVKLTINKNLFNATNGRIRNFTFLISERNCQEDPRPNYNFSKNNLDQPLPSWIDLKDDECTGQYQIHIFPNDYDNVKDGNFEFIIGNEICDNTMKYSPYCNGPLKFGTEYSIIGRVFTNNSYGDTNPIYFVTENNFTILIVIIMCIFISALFGGFGIKWYKSKKPDNKEPPASIIPDMVDNDTPDRKYRHFLKYDLDVITNEYRSINELDLSDLTTDAAEQNQWKNRYANIMPYDQNRVYLIQSNYCSTDYINASFVNGFLRPDEYIATQGPTVHTCYDFWSMIIEKNCHEIIMLTKLNEGGIAKCDQYYPYPNGERKFYDINVTNVMYLRQKLCIKREIQVTRGTVERLIVQYHFEKWSDHSGLDNELDLIELIEFVRSENRSNVLKTPIVVHCSAGSGRTGTFIALDILMQQIENGKNCDVCETVKNLRYDRMNLVQTLVQYEFLYKCVAWYIRRKWSNIDI